MLESQKKAIKKYVEKNRSKINEYNRDRYSKLRETNEEKYQQILETKRQYYHKRKAVKLDRELENAENIEVKENQEINLQ
jgi:hypothetical protein